MKKYNIYPNNVYNINEKGIIIRVLIKLKVIYSRKYNVTLIVHHDKSKLQYVKVLRGLK
jgi:hypothetical protein